MSAQWFQPADKQDEPDKRAPRTADHEASQEHDHAANGDGNRHARYTANGTIESRFDLLEGKSFFATQWRPLPFIA